MTTWQRLLTSYTPEKKAWDCHYPWLAFVWRPLSFVITWLLLPLGVTANHVTFFTAVLGLALLTAYATGHFLWGTCFLLLLNLFDCVDGNLARLSPAQGPPRGKFYDQLVGNFWYVAYFSMGVGLWLTHEGPWGAACLVAGTLSTVAKFLSLNIRHIFWDILGPFVPSPSTGTTPSAPPHLWAKKVFLNLTDLQGQDPLLLMLVLLGKLDFFLLISAAFLGAECVILLVHYWRRARRLSPPC